MFTEIFGNSPQVQLLDFFADHVDFDYTISQMHEFTRISRPTLYKLVDRLAKEQLLVFTREVGGSRFYRMNLNNPKVIWMLQTDVSEINKELAVTGFEGPPTSAVGPTGGIGARRRRRNVPSSSRPPTPLRQRGTRVAKLKKGKSAAR